MPDADDALEDAHPPDVRHALDRVAELRRRSSSRPEAFSRACSAAVSPLSGPRAAEHLGVVADGRARRARARTAASRSRCTAGARTYRGRPPPRSAAGAVPAQRPERLRELGRVAGDVAVDLAAHLRAGVCVDDDEHDRGGDQHHPRHPRRQPPAQAAPAASALRLVLRIKAIADRAHRHDRHRWPRRGAACGAGSRRRRRRRSSPGRTRSPTRRGGSARARAPGRGCAAGTTSSSNSVVESRTSSPPRRTSRVIRLTSMSPPSSVVVRRLRRDPQLRADPRGELAQRERLGQVVDGAGVEPGDAMLDLAAGREHDHRQRRLGVAQRRQHLEPAAAREHHVEHDQIDVLAQRLLGAGDAVERRGDVEPVGARARARGSRRSPARPRSRGSVRASPRAVLIARATGSTMRRS